MAQTQRTVERELKRAEIGNKIIHELQAKQRFTRFSEEELEKLQEMAEELTKFRNHFGYQGL